MDSLFERAKREITPQLIEFTFGPGEWKGDEFWCTNPLRPDAHNSSFSINGRSYTYYDFASGDKGDFIDLYAKTRGISSVEAARLIAKEEAPEKKEYNPKTPPQPCLNLAYYERAVNKISSMKMTFKDGRKSVALEYGAPVLKSHYINADGAAMFTVARYERIDEQGKKDKTQRQFYYGVDEKLHTGLPWPENRPLWNLPRLISNPALPVLVVEGEKCASVAHKYLPHYVAVTWAGGSQAVAKTDWSVLSGREVTIWPDADSAGVQAAKKIQELVPQARMLTLPTDAPKGWDIADCVASGIKPADIISAEVTSVYQGPQMPKNVKPLDREPENTHRSYTPLGHDENFYYFMLETREIFSVPKGKWTSSIIAEIAPPSEWGLRAGMLDWVQDPKLGYESEFTTRSGNLKVTQIQVVLTSECKKAGKFNASNLRGVGVWKDEDGHIIVHDGKTIKRQDGQPLPIDRPGKYHYISSSAEIDDFFGEIATIEDGKALTDGLKVLPFKNETASVMATGWSMIAPFAGCLHWRPHIWITGPTGSGKSTMILSRLIKPLLGSGHYSGTAEATGPSIRNTLKNDCRPAVLDEFEPTNARQRQNIDNTLTLVRNASSDESSASSVMDMDKGVQTYHTRSCFCMSSINTTDMEKATESRITPIEIMPTSIKDRIAMQPKLSAFDKLLREKSAHFRRRTFKNLHLILQDIEWLKNELRERIGNDRRVDQLTPMIAAFYALTTDELGDAKRDPFELLSFATKHIDIVQEELGEVESDEDFVFEKILHHIEDKVHSFPISSLIESVIDGTETTSAHNALQKLGIKITFTDAEQPLHLCVYAGSKYLKEIFKDTRIYNFAPQLKRHPLAVSSQTTLIRMLGARTRVIKFDFEKFKERYLDVEPENHSTDHAPPPT